MSAAQDIIEDPGTDYVATFACGCQHVHTAADENDVPALQAVALKLTCVHCALAKHDLGRAS